jgi:hypothetical protein
MYLLLIDSLLVFLQVVLLGAAPGADDPDAPKPTATIVIDKLTAEDHKTLATTGRLSIVKQDAEIYVPGPIIFPCSQTWTSWWAKNYWYFQCLANMACKPYRGCWCNACACYLFIVNLQYPPCRRWLPWEIDVSSIKVEAYRSTEAEDGKSFQ